MVIPSKLVRIPGINGDAIDIHHWLSYPSINRPAMITPFGPSMAPVMQVQLLRNASGLIEERSQVPDVYCTNADCPYHPPDVFWCGSEPSSSDSLSITVSYLRFLHELIF